MFKISAKYLIVVLKSSIIISDCLSSERYIIVPFITKQEQIPIQGSKISAHWNPYNLSIQLGAKSYKVLSNKNVSASHTF